MLGEVVRVNVASSGFRLGGQGSPWTDRGRSVAYGAPPWRMSGRALALWYRLADPAEARRHVPPDCAMDDDPVVRARFWEVRHDGGLGDDTVPPRRQMDFREAVLAFPVECAGVSGDFTTYMYADDPVYTAFGREVMGWPLRHGQIDITTINAVGSPRPGAQVSGSLQRDGIEVMRMDLTLTVPLVDSLRPSGLPRWIAWKLIPKADGREPAINEFVETGPSAMRWGSIWAASGTLDFGDAPADELHFLQPREIVGAQYWVEVDLTLGPGRVLKEGLDANSD